MGMNEENYVKQAEIAIKEIREAKNKYGKPIKPLTTSQIRNILAVTADIYNEIMNQTEGTSDELSKDVCARINYLKVRLVYESGRDEKVKVFVEKHIYYSFWSQLKKQTSISFVQQIYGSTGGISQILWWKRRVKEREVGYYVCKDSDNR